MEMKMSKKILIGSIIVVSILIGVSFTSVVGYRSVTSDVKSSPLFNIRSSRAIDRYSNDLNCEYVGKGDETNIHISNLTKRTEHNQKVIEIISHINEKDYNTLVTQIIRYLKYQNDMTDKEISEILQTLLYIRRNPNNAMYRDTQNIYEIQDYTKDIWFPGCIPYLIVTYIFLFMFLLRLKIWELIQDIKFIFSIQPCACSKTLLG
jgi:hypothetical protein